MVKFVRRSEGRIGFKLEIEIDDQFVEMKTEIPKHKTHMETLIAFVFTKLVKLLKLDFIIHNLTKLQIPSTKFLAYCLTMKMFSSLAYTRVWMSKGGDGINPDFFPWNHI